MNMKLITASIVAATVLVGCSSKQPDTEATTRSGAPMWVFNPSVDGGLAATGCTPASGNVSLDSNRADLLARQQLASSLGTQVQAMAEDFQRRVETTEDGVATGGNFEQIVREIVDERLVGSRRVTADYVDLADRQHFCSMVAVTESSIDSILAASAAASNVEPDVFTASQMREMYMSQNAINRLNDALGQ
ncbi:MAG: hypothetical protein JXQ97_17210 [Natronospirillum sp.]